jgi:hypothetical protein
MTAQERIATVQTFGYNPAEARFLYIAALQSGYFLRRQFLSFIGGTKGWKDVAFINKLRANRHCRITVYRHNCMLYHLSAKPLYLALGDQDNRNRREHQPTTIKNKLMALDYVLEYPAHHYLATEREKLDYFTSTLKIASEDLPTRWFESPRKREATAKYFVEKYPLFIAAPPEGTQFVAHFGYVDEGLQSTDRFQTFLEQYNRLLAALPDFRVIYIANSLRLFENARQRFEELFTTTGRQNAPFNTTTRVLLEYFEARREYEARDFSRFDTARLIRYRDAKKRFADQQYEALYSQWRACGTGALLTTLHPDQPSKETPVERFSTYLLNHDYDLFGTLTNPSSHPVVAARVQTEKV